MWASAPRIFCSFVPLPADIDRSRLSTGLTRPELCRYNPLGEKGARAVVDVVKYNLPLQELKLQWCKIGDKAGAEALGELLQFNETIEVRTQCRAQPLPGHR